MKTPKYFCVRFCNLIFMLRMPCGHVNGRVIGIGYPTGADCIALWLESAKNPKIGNPGSGPGPGPKPGFGFGFRVCSKPWFLLLKIFVHKLKSVVQLSFPQKM